MTTDIDICNQALALLRADSITAFNQGTNEADICNTFYDDFVNDILTRYPWSFATKKAALSSTTAPLNEYRYAHTIPTEALRLWALFPSSSVGAVPINDYDIQSPSTGRVVFSNQENLWADYTLARDEQYWPGYFVQFAIHAFAALIAVPVTDQVDLADMLHRKAWGAPSENELGGKYGVAIRIDAQQKPGEIITDSPLIAARFS